MCSSDLDPAVARIFVFPGAKVQMCKDARGNRDWLRKIRPWWGHHTHFHVRLACPKGARACVNQAPPPPGDVSPADLSKAISQEMTSTLTYLTRLGYPPRRPRTCLFVWPRRRFFAGLVLIAAIGLTPVSARGQSADIRAAYDQAGVLYKAGDYGEALLQAEVALTLAEEELGNDHQAVAGYLMAVAAIQHALGADAEAEPLLIRALEIREAASDPEPLDIAEALDRAGQVMIANERYLEAESLLLRSLEIRRQALGDDHVLIADSDEILATLYRRQRLYADAEPLYRQALEIRTAAYGGDDPRVADSLEDLHC